VGEGGFERSEKPGEGVMTLVALRPLTRLRFAQAPSPTRGEGKS
jgi:hypothetical protein